METPNSNVSLKRPRNDEIGSFKIIHTDTDTDDNSINGNANKKKIISEYKIVYNETRQSNRHKNPSGVWKYFALATKDTSTGDNSFKDEPDDRVLCMLCYNKGRVHVYKSKTSSSNLWKHLNRKHDIEIPTERMFAVSTSSLDRFEFNSEEIDDGNSSNDCQLPVLDEENNDVLIKADDFEGIEEYTEEEEDEQTIQSSLSNEMIDDNILRYGISSSSSRMTKDIGLAIIEEVAKRPILYEVQMSKLSTVKASKKVMWEEVYDALGQIVPIERIQKIWKNIRDRYKKIRNIERDGMKCIAKYKYYDHLGFLDDDEQLGCQLSDVEFEEQPEEKKPRPEDFSFLIEQTDSILTSVDDLVQNDQNYTTEDVVSETSSNCIVSSSNPPTITTTIYPMEMNTTNSEVIITKRPPTPATAPPQTAPPPPQQPDTPPVANNTEQMDEFDLFGKLIANKLRNTPRDRVNLIEVKIMQAILENT